jgi:hypothetical protein
MGSSYVKAAIAVSMLALPLAACGSNVATGAAGGAVTGAVVGGPVGAAVGGVAGATVGAALTPDEGTRVREYVVSQRHPSVRLRDDVVVGYEVPSRVRLYPVPPDVGLRSDYEYAVINCRPVLVEPQTRRVVYIVE